MAKESESSVEQLAAAQQKLKSVHAKLVKEFEKLHNAEFSAAGHREYLEKLKAHLLELEKHTAAIHKQHEALHSRRETLHEQHEAGAVTPAWSWRKPRTRDHPEVRSERTNLTADSELTNVRP
jgi:chromosome segregation ATPase